MLPCVQIRSFVCSLCNSVQPNFFFFSPPTPPFSFFLKLSKFFVCLLYVQFSRVKTIVFWNYVSLLSVWFLLSMQFSTTQNKCFLELYKLVFHLLSVQFSTAQTSVFWNDVFSLLSVQFFAFLYSRNKWANFDQIWYVKKNLVISQHFFHFFFKHLKFRGRHKK